MKKLQMVADRFPSSFARERADAAIDKLSEDEPMSKYIDVWLETYRKSGGTESRPKR
jgi:hypothetical protein